MDEMSFGFFNWVNRTFFATAKYIFHLAVLIIYPMITWRYYLRYDDYRVLELLF